MGKRVRLCPEITDPRLRGFLDIVPSIRRFQDEVIREQKLTGEKIGIELLGREITVCFHRSALEGKRPVVFELHGGGFVLGSTEKNDSICQKICEGLGCHVIGINYRLAPEHPYPAALQDVCDVIDYFQKHEEEFHIDIDRMAVFGYSGGATLAAATMMQSLKEKRFHLCAQVLHYPFLDSTHMPDEKEHYDCDMDEEILRAFTLLYAKEEERTNPLVSPICATREDLEGTAPTCILTAERDSLKQEGILYGELLREAGVQVYCQVIPEVHHGYLEDAGNLSIYEEGTAQEVKQKHSPYFRDWTKAALGISCTFLKNCFQGEKKT